MFNFIFSSNYNKISREPQYPVKPDTELYIKPGYKIWSGLRADIRKSLSQQGFVSTNRKWLLGPDDYVTNYYRNCTSIPFFLGLWGGGEALALTTCVRPLSRIISGIQKSKNCLSRKRLPARLIISISKIIFKSNIHIFAPCLRSGHDYARVCPCRLTLVRIRILFWKE